MRCTLTVPLPPYVGVANYNHISMKRGRNSSPPPPPAPTRQVLGVPRVRDELAEIDDGEAETNASDRRRVVNSVDVLAKQNCRAALVRLVNEALHSQCEDGNSRSLLPAQALAGSGREVAVPLARAAAESVGEAKRLCHVCLGAAIYRCNRCLGQNGWVCSVQCRDVHLATRCQRRVK
jgi:hypothetical protein